MGAGSSPTLTPRACPTSVLGGSPAPLIVLGARGWVGVRMGRQPDFRAWLHRELIVSNCLTVRTW